MTQLNTAAVDAILRQAADLVGTGPFSRRLAAVADAWTADKEAAASTADLVETNGAILRAGLLRIREAVGVVHRAAAVPARRCERAVFSTGSVTFSHGVLADESKGVGRW